MIERSIQREDVTLLCKHLCTRHGSIWKCGANTGGHEGRDRQQHRVGDFNAHWHRRVDRPDKINTETAGLNDTLDRMNWIDIFRTFYPKAAAYTFFPSAVGAISRLYHMLGHKTSLNEFWKTEIISSIFSNHNGRKLEIIRKLKNTPTHGG